MRADPDRVSRIRRTLAEARCDAIVCALPANVLLLSGYCPVVGTSIAIATAGGRVVVLAPEDEAQLAADGRADEIRLFSAASLERIESTAEAVQTPLAEAMRDLGLERAAIAHDGGEMGEPAPYVAVHLYGSRFPQLLAEASAGARLIPGKQLLEALRAVKTPAEIEAIGLACNIAGEAFAQASGQLHPGLSESEAAARFRFALLSGHPELHDTSRLGGDTFCTSGPNSYHASAAYQRSRGRRIGSSEPILIHCNSQVNGWWTDITRTYCLGEPTSRQTRIYDAIFEARAAALAAIRPGVRAAEVDHAARDVLATRGFGDAFKHSTGHGVGFSAISHNALPRLHPRSPDVLEEGMVFNVEPAVYIEGFGGMRHCDVVAVRAEGAQVLTPFQSQQDELLISPRSVATPNRR